MPAGDVATRIEMSREHRTAVLRAAAVPKQAAAVTRAHPGLRQLIKSGHSINFRTVAKAGSVSANFLYTNPELRARIVQLRAQQQRRPGPPPRVNGLVTAPLSAPSPPNSPPNEANTTVKSPN